MYPDKERPAENTCRIVKGLDAVWAHFCPSKPCLPSSIDGIEISATKIPHFSTLYKTAACEFPSGPDKTAILPSASPSCTPA